MKCRTSAFIFACCFFALCTLCTASPFFASPFDSHPITLGAAVLEKACSYLQARKGFAAAHPSECKVADFYTHSLKCHSRPSRQQVFPLPWQSPEVHLSSTGICVVRYELQFRGVESEAVSDIVWLQQDVDNELSVVGHVDLNRKRNETAGMPHSRFQLTTYNIWNINQFWKEQRSPLVEQLMSSTKSDVLAIQELRKEYGFGVHQVEEMSLWPSLAKYDFIYFPAWLTDFEEGLAIFSALPMVSASARTFVSRSHRIPRAALHAKIRISQGEYADVFVSHLSLELRNRAYDLNHMKAFADDLWNKNKVDVICPSTSSAIEHVCLDTQASSIRHHQFIVGDLNTTPEQPELRILIKPNPHIPFHDAWLQWKSKYITDTSCEPSNLASSSFLSIQSYCANPNGFTFPTDNIKKRIDFVYYRTEQEDFVVSDAHVQCFVEGHQIVPSDHCALTTQFLLHKNDGHEDASPSSINIPGTALNPFSVG